MAHRGVCPDMACERVAIEAQRQPTERKAIIIVADELGVPFKTVETWLQRHKAPSNEGKKAQNLDVHTGNETCATSDLQTLIDTGKKFGTIYADPPWPYQNQATRSATDNHYSTMNLEDIAALPISQLTAGQAHLHLWTTNGFLFESKAILEAWGFEYKSCFVWVKPEMGIGNYWRVSHEFLLLGVKGKLTFADHTLMSWLHHNRVGHSRKPEAVRQFIEKASPGPFIELFARRTTDGWTAWGNEIERTIFNEQILLSTR